MSDPAFVILAKEGPGNSLIFHNTGKVAQAHLIRFSKIALKEGYDLMFEFDEAPDMRVICARTESGEGISSMKSMVRLWTLGL